MNASAKVVSDLWGGEESLEDKPPSDTIESLFLDQLRLEIEENSSQTFHELA